MDSCEGDDITNDEHETLADDDDDDNDKAAAPPPFLVSGSHCGRDEDADEDTGTTLYFLAFRPPITIIGGDLLVGVRKSAMMI